MRLGGTASKPDNPVHNPFNVFLFFKELSRWFMKLLF